MNLLLFNLATDSQDPILGFTTSWIRALAKEVDFIHVITMRAGKVEVPSNVQVHSVGKERGYSEPRRAFEFYRILLRVLRVHSIDVCFSHMIPLFTVLAAPILKTRGIPTVTWFAHPSATTMLKLAHYASDRMVSSLSTAYPYKKDKLVVVGQGIDSDFFSPEQVDLPSQRPIILCVGRLSPVKGHLTLIEAARLLRNTLAFDFVIRIIGGPATPTDEQYVGHLHQRIKDLALLDILELHPPVQMGCLPAHYRKATVNVNLTPSGFGDKVALEAMSCARPCLVANAGFVETIGRYSDILLFRHGDPVDLAKHLERILTLEEDERRAIGLYLREQVLRMHSLNGLTDRLTTILSQFLSQKHLSKAGQIRPHDLQE